MFLYSLLVLPEAMTPARKEELMEANEATLENFSRHSHENENEGGTSGEDNEDSEQALTRWHKLLNRINFLKKLAILLPQRSNDGNGRDYRLFVLAIAFCIYRIGGLYTNDVCSQ